jgi:dipeptidyl aminopeptidase/acylaminoacyl peptidase
LSEALRARGRTRGRSGDGSGPRTLGAGRGAGPAPRGGRASIALLALLLAATACGDSPSGPGANGDIVGGVDLAALFAPPTAGERAAVEAEWAGRTPSAAQITEEAEFERLLGGDGVRVRIVTHEVDGHRHAGAILQAADPPAGPRPVLVFSHGGDNGVDLEEVLLAAATLGYAADDVVLVVPAFRGEAVRFGGGTWESSGPPSPWDRDVDDALALIEVALETVSYADPERIGVLGFSRGGAVALLMAIREPRIRAVASFFGPTDFFGPYVEGVVRAILEEQPPNLPGVTALDTQVLRGLQEGTQSIAWARLELMRRSPARFADRLPAVQVHHGTADQVVPVGEAERLVAAMQAIGRGPPTFEAHFYEGAGHSPLAMPVSIPRTSAFFNTFLVDASSTLSMRESR